MKMKVSLKIVAIKTLKKHGCEKQNPVRNEFPDRVFYTNLLATIFISISKARNLACGAGAHEQGTLLCHSCRCRDDRLRG